ncbi:MAG: hypothetical protein IJE98_07015, partial [Oscillospiraceae bacterium]|nr:hypothetical protein [Oscillospiraceae bacterium]
CVNCSDPSIRPEKSLSQKGKKTEKEDPFLAKTNKSKKRNRRKLMQYTDMREPIRPSTTDGMEKRPFPEKEKWAFLCKR